MQEIVPPFSFFGTIFVVHCRGRWPLKKNIHEVEMARYLHYK